MKQQYPAEYFSKFRAHGAITGWLLKRVDRKEPVFSWLKKEYLPQSTLLDFGCGAGWFLASAEKYFDGTGIDNSLAAITKARVNCRRSRFILGDEKILKIIPDKSYKIITAFDVLEHMDDYSLLLKEINRLLMPAGRLIISVPNNDSIAHRLIGKKWWAYEDPSHVWLKDIRFWNMVLNKYGFRTVKRFSIGLINHPSPMYALHGGLKVLHYFTQGMALNGIALPIVWDDVLFLAAMKE
jgi:ubiquinone/menaquinone biosynthesis C-methylase UbiE